jgi:MoaA/NifB/PqqE/SkfB family radical SAM enzyme
VALALVPSLHCNLRCAHCFAATDKNTPAMSEGDLVALLDQIEPLGLRAVEITGGEFFAYKPAPAILPRLAALSVPTTIFTNGTLLETKHLDAIGGSQVTLRMSLDGPAPLHDEVRGAGAFAAMSDAARLCRDSGVAFELSSTVTRSSLPKVAETVQAALELGARGISFGPLHRLGGRSTAIAEERLDDEGCVDLAATLTALRERVPDGFDLSWRTMTMRAVAVMHPCSVYACWGDNCLSQKHWPNYLAVLPDGTVLPQSLHIHRRYSIGNGIHDGLSELLLGYWGSTKHDEFRRLCRHIYQDLIYGSERPLFLWDELAYEASQRPVEELPVHETVTHPYDHTEEMAEARRAGELDDVVFPLPFR